MAKVGASLQHAFVSASEDFCLTGAI